MNTLPRIQDLRSILVLRGDGSLADAILSSCCYRELKKANPKIKITVASFGPAYELFKSNSYVDCVVKLPFAALAKEKVTFQLLRKALKLRLKKFDLVLDSSNKDFFAWRLFKKIAGANRLLDASTSPQQPFGAPDQHNSVHEQAILKQLGVENPDKSYDLPVSSGSRQRVENWLEKHSLQKYILFNPFGSAKERRFRADTMRELCVSFRRLGLPFVVPAKVQDLAELTQIFKEEKDVFVGDIVEFSELFELVRRSSLVISTDSSVVHIASGFEKPGVFFYHQSTVFTAPENPKAVVLMSKPEDINFFDWWKLNNSVDSFQEKI
ncbi:MAG: glycosyltransferase family 9 protein [Elusimicrobiaceae bacterium]|nr:glycosyltransferase family 9 protein [Elusimicrobiaceae bacterium]